MILEGFSAPYAALAWLTEPLLAALLCWLIVALAGALRAAWRSDSGLAAAGLIAAALFFLAARWLFVVGHQFAVIGMVFAAGGMALYRPGATPTPPPPALPWWSGLVVIVVATALKCVGLEDWPPHLNEYSAETGYWGLRTLDGYWPKSFLAGKEYDLVNGGLSPLHLPLLWVSVRLLGGTIAAVRFAEVIASTLLLLVFWQWLRRHLTGGWALAALAVFALSPWHLAQSRMGTFYSASVALGLCILLLGEKLVGAVERRDGSVAADLVRWFGFAFATGLIGYAYAPLKVLYLFFLFVIGAATISAWRTGRSGWWCGPLLAAGALAAILTVQLAGSARFEEMFRRDFGVLATDTSVWKKTIDDQITDELQPPSVIAVNVARNLVTWWQWSWTEAGVLVWYAPALTVAVPAAVLFLLRRREWVVALYFLIGVLPPLIIYPVLRRTLILWPLVYVAGVVAARELTRVCAVQIGWRWWRSASWALFWCATVLTTAHGLHVYVTTNSIVGIDPYFGPDHQLDMYLEGERMLPHCRVYFVNPTYEESIVATVRLFAAGRATGDPEAFGFLRFAPGDDSPDVLRDRPLCFFDLNRPDEKEDQVEGAIESLAARFGGGITIQRWAGDGSDTLFYTILTVPAESPEEADD